MHALQTNGQQPNILSVLQWLPFALALMCWSSIASAAEYTIQVGAFTSPNQNFAEDLRSYGEVNTAQSDGGFTVFTVGRYNSIDEAKGDLNRIATDYPGAFVRNMPAAAGSVDLASRSATPSSNTTANTTASTTTPRKAATQPSASKPETQLWESLSESERRRVVYLDGVLHLKQGDEFVPLANYRRSQGQ